MEIFTTPLEGLIIIEPKVFGDNRGFFQETYQKERYKEAGLNIEFVQDNYSRSGRGVLRGLHFQKKYPQGKLVFVVKGEVFDVSVDLRSGSPTFGKWFGTVLSEENHRQIYVPPGFAHGFRVLSESADFMYKCTDYYHPEDEGGIIWNDPDIGIDWQGENPILADKDRNFPMLRDLTEKDLPELEN